CLLRSVRVEIRSGLLRRQLDVRIEHKDKCQYSNRTHAPDPQAYCVHRDHCARAGEGFWLRPAKRALRSRTADQCKRLWQTGLAVNRLARESTSVSLAQRAYNAAHKTTLQAALMPLQCYRVLV